MIVTLDLVVSSNLFIHHENKLKVFSTAKFKQNIFSILAQMWQYNSGLRTLDNKNGNWKYLHVQWTLPLKEEKEEILIETLNGDFLGLNEKKQVVLLSSSELIELQRLYELSEPAGCQCPYM